MIVQPAVELATLLRRGHADVARALWRVFEAEARGQPAGEASRDLGLLLSRIVGLSDLLGRRRVEIATGLMGGARAAAGAATEQPAILVPGVTWSQAIQDITARYPRVVPESMRSLGATSVQEWMGALYERHGFSLAKTAQDVVVRRVQTILQGAFTKSALVSRQEVIDRILATGGEFGDAWTQGYADTVYRNNANTAYTAGIHSQMEDPAVQRVIGALQFEASMDGDTTDICRAAHGTRAPAGHPIWDSRSPPLHHGCRSGLRLVSHTDLKRSGGVDENGQVITYTPNMGGGHPVAQPGFGGRRMP